MTASFRKPELSPDELTLHLVASGVIKLAEIVKNGQAPTLPYPKELQRGLDRLVLTCLRQGRTPPQGVPDLLSWCRRPLAEWSLELPEKDAGPADKLLDGQIPTGICEEWAIASSDVEDEFESQWRGNERSLQRGLVSKFASTGAWILIAPLMAVERGHNMLNDEDKAAIGAAYFLVRPHPRPDDINYAIHSINRWAIEHFSDIPWLTSKCQDVLTLDRVGHAFRDEAYKRWRYLLRLPMIYSTLPDREREAVTWNQLVSI